MHLDLRLSFFFGWGEFQGPRPPNFQLPFTPYKGHYYVFPASCPHLLFCMDPYEIVRPHSHPPGGGGCVPKGGM